MADEDPKYQSLKASGTLNRHPEKIVAAKFQGSDFFDPRDLLQVRYEMVHDSETSPLAQVAEAFGVSVATCARARRAFHDGGLQALIPRRRGPKGNTKVTDDILDFVRVCKASYPRVGVRQLVPLIEHRFGVRLHPRTISKALERSKKNSRAGGKDPQ